MKKTKNTLNLNTLSQNIYLLYFLFFATVVHLGYFLFLSETQSLVLFTLVFVFVYLIDKNMVIVLGITLGFVDLMYIIQHTQEGMKGSKDSSMNDISGNKQPLDYDGSMNDISGNKQPFMNRYQENFEDETSEPVTQDKVTGTSLNTIKIDAKKMGNIIEKIKSTPELANAFNLKQGVDMTNGVDITELNKLVTKLNNIVDTFS